MNEISCNAMKIIHGIINPEGGGELNGSKENVILLGVGGIVFIFPRFVYFAMQWFC